MMVVNVARLRSSACEMMPLKLLAVKILLVALRCVVHAWPSTQKMPSPSKGDRLR